MRNVPHKLGVARGEEPAELVFKNAQLINVLSAEIYLTNVAVDDGRVVGIGDYEGREEIDLEGAWLAPSLIDGHFHVERTMLTIPEFVRAAVPHGTGRARIEQGFADRFFNHTPLLRAGDAPGDGGGGFHRG